MARLARYLLTAAFFGCAIAGPSGSERYDAATHVPRKSPGCGKDPPYKVGVSLPYHGTYGGVKYLYRVYIPTSYDKNTPMPLILQHHGWGMRAKKEEDGSGIIGYAESLGFINVYPQGNDDNPRRGKYEGGPWYSWNAVGSTLSPGPGGQTCLNNASAPSYCYTSCEPCNVSPQCWWTTCSNEVTPSGTGTPSDTKVNGFIPSLYDTLEEQLCLDTTREFAAGESNGGMMTYQLGVDMATRLAAIAPQFGSFHVGFNLAPAVGVPLLDIHGRSDCTVPANVSVSNDGYIYTPLREILDGNKYNTRGWRAANGCSGKDQPYTTRYTGVKQLWCVTEGTCTGGDVVRCSYKGGHNWFSNGGVNNGGLVTEFLFKWKKSSHIGRGYSEGEARGAGVFLEDITLSEEDPIEDAPQWRRTLKTTPQGHYGNPADGCLADEDVVPVGTGHICAPRIGTEVQNAALPVPKCQLGGVAASNNGCPTDANIVDTSNAWPICLAKSKEDEKCKYEDGEFHCLLVCPCMNGTFVGDECSKESHDHCPLGARCEMGELKKRDQGVCTYALSSDTQVMALVI